MPLDDVQQHVRLSNRQQTLTHNHTSPAPAGNGSAGDTAAVAAVAAVAASGGGGGVAGASKADFFAHARGPAFSSSSSSLSAQLVYHISPQHHRHLSGGGAEGERPDDALFRLAAGSPAAGPGPVQPARSPASTVAGSSPPPTVDVMYDGYPSKRSRRRSGSIYLGGGSGGAGEDGQPVRKVHPVSWLLSGYCFRIGMVFSVALWFAWLFVGFPDNYSSIRLFSSSGPAPPAERDEVPVSAEEKELLKSTHCTRAQPGKALVQYALMIDAGSSGSRIHVYRFNNCKDSPQLEYEVFHHIEPGLSHYLNDPVGAATSLDPLLRVALDNVPRSLHSCTPVAVKATAGLRLLGEEKSLIILDAVENKLRKHYPFRLIDDGVSIMDGRDEGIYAWITVNYLLGSIGRTTRSPTAAIFDLGGGSTQIVFEPDPSHQLKEGEHKHVLTFGGQTYKLYQHSYLGYGLNEARRSMKERAIRAWRESGRTGPTENPCLGWGREETYNDRQGEEHALVGTADGVERCAALARATLRREAACHLEPCSFDGIYQPSLKDTFRGDAYVFSYFYDRAHPLGLVPEFRVGAFGAAADQLCRGDLAGFSGTEEVRGTARREYEKNADLCLELAFMYALLRDGYGMGDDRVVKVAKKIDDVETGWCLGASIAVLDSKPWCPPDAGE